MTVQAQACAASTQPAILYLSGAVRAELVDRPGFGFMISPNMGNRLDKPALWAAENGCFSAGARFRVDTFYRFLDHMAPVRSSCLFALAPDVLADARATWERSAPVLPVLRKLGYRSGLVAQDGIEYDPLDWAAFDALFIGGSTAWKLSPAAAGIAAAARAHGKHVHMGRVNSLRRLRYAYDIGCDSVDGTFLAFAPDINLPRVQRWLDDITRSPSLWR